MITSIYDEAIYITNEEAKIRGLRIQEVQACVEKPQIHIFERTASSETEQLAYMDTRNECIQGLSFPVETSTGIQINDVMRFVGGDNPERQMESGEQRGGRQGCSGCNSESRRYYDLSYCFRAILMNLADRQSIVLSGHCGRIGRNDSIRPFEKLRVEQLKTELRSRGIEPVGLKKDLEVELGEILGGVQRVRALLINNHRTPIADTNLHSYEVLPGESLHDVKGHIKNLLDELKFHLEDDVRKHYEEHIKLQLGIKMPWEVQTYDLD